MGCRWLSLLACRVAPPAQHFASDVLPSIVHFLHLLGCRRLGLHTWWGALQAEHFALRCAVVCCTLCILCAAVSWDYKSNRAHCQQSTFPVMSCRLFYTLHLVGCCQLRLQVQQGSLPAEHFSCDVLPSVLHFPSCELLSAETAGPAGRIASRALCLWCAVVCCTLCILCAAVSWDYKSNRAHCQQSTFPVMSCRLFYTLHLVGCCQLRLQVQPGSLPAEHFASVCCAAICCIFCILWAAIDGDYKPGVVHCPQSTMPLV